MLDKQKENNHFLFPFLKKDTFWGYPGGPIVDSAFPLQGAKVPSLVGGTKIPHATGHGSEWKREDSNIAEPLLCRSLCSKIWDSATNNKRWRGCGEKGILLHCWWECKLVQPIWRTVWRFLKKLEAELPYDPPIPLLGKHTKETKIERDTCTPMFTAALLTTARKDMEAT